MHYAPADHSGPLLVFGGSGAVGRFLLRRLACECASVIAISRQPMPGWAAGWSSIEWRTGSLQHCPPIPRVQPLTVLSAGPLDAFCDWIDTADLGDDARVVALSSMSAVWKRDSPAAAERDLAARLLDCEARLQSVAATRRVTLQLLRPTLIYGAGLDRSLSPLLAFARRRGWLPWPSGARGLRQPVHADDVAAAILASARTDVGPRVLALPGGETLAFDVLLRRLLAELAPGARLLRVPMPAALLARMATAGGGLGRVAAPLYRSHIDQLADAGGWPALGIQPRAFAPRPDDFLHW